MGRGGLHRRDRELTLGETVLAGASGDGTILTKAPFNLKLCLDLTVP